MPTERRAGEAMIPRVVHRLLRMSPREVGVRIGAALAAVVDRPLHDAGLRREPLRERPRPFPPLWITGEDERRVADAVRIRSPREIDDVVADADAVLLGRFHLLGRSYQFDRPIPWSADPVTGRPWPDSFHRAVDIFSGSGAHGDVKDVWELNRHQFLPTLGKAYRLTREERYAEAALDLMENWIATNPYKRGINWTSALEIAVRSLAWCWTLELLEGASALRADRRGPLERSLAEHARYLEENLSFYFSPYNHLVGEATALYLLGSVLEGRPRALRWREIGWRILIDTMPSQFHPDGGTVEQASGYHFFTQGFYLQAFLHAKRRGDAIPISAWNHFQRTFDYAAALQLPDGTMPMIGDGDEGKALALRQTSTWDFRPYIAIGAVLFARADLRRIAGSFPSDAAWLVGLAGWETYERLPAGGSGAEATVLRDSGYVLLRDRAEPGHRLLFDAGPLADGVPFEDFPSAAHGHADALSIEWTAFGQSILIDPGFFTYNGDIEWHRYFRETEAHNTLVVDGASQATYRGRLTWSRAPRVRLTEFESGRGFAFAEGDHDAYERLQPSQRYRRSVLYLDPGEWIVRDELEGGGSHEVDRWLHFAPSVEVNEEEGGVLLGRAGPGVAFRIQTVSTPGATVVVRRGGPAPGDGWVATGYGARVSAFVARLRCVATTPAVFHLLLTAGNGPAAPGSRLQIVEGSADERAIVILRDGGARDLILYGVSGTITEAAGIRTDARIACVRLSPSGSVATWFCAGGASVSYLNQRLDDRADRGSTTGGEAS